MMRKVYFIIIAILCLLSCIVPAMAVYDMGYLDALEHTYNSGTVNGNSLDISFAYAQYIRPTNQWYQPVNYVSINGVVYYLDGYRNAYNSRSDVPKTTITLSAYQEGENTFYIIPNTWGSTSTIKVNFVYTTEPPAPEGPYLTATILSESTTGTMYEIKPMPNDNSYSFSYISVGNAPASNGIGSPYHNPVYNSEQVAIRYKVPAGETVSFYCYALSSGFTFDLQLISISATGTSLNDEEIINQTSPEIRPNNTAYNPPPVPTARPGTSDNPINSGNFKPSSNTYITPFSQFTENARELTRLPEMANPTELRQTIANTTAGNITAPLYDSIEGFSNLLIFPAVTISQNIQFILQPIEEMLLYCDDVLKEVFKTVNTFFNTIYPLRDFFYMLIPDFVWWIMATLLIFEIVVTLMTFIYGRSVTFYYLFGLGEDKK